jgi:hypothetical protein
MIASNDEIKFSVAISELLQLAQSNPSAFLEKTINLLTSYIRSRSPWPIDTRRQVTVQSQRTTRDRTQSALSALQALAFNSHNAHSLNLSNSNLSGLNLFGLNSFANLDHSNLSKTGINIISGINNYRLFVGTDFSDSVISGDLSNVEFFNCDISGTNFQEIEDIAVENLENARFELMSPPTGLPSRSRWLIDGMIRLELEEEVSLSLPTPTARNTETGISLSQLEIDDLWKSGKAPKPISRDGESFDFGIDDPDGS